MGTYNVLYVVADSKPGKPGHIVCHDTWTEATAMAVLDMGHDTAANVKSGRLAGTRLLATDLLPNTVRVAGDGVLDTLTVHSSFFGTTATGKVWYIGGADNRKIVARKEEDNADTKFFTATPANTVVVWCRYKPVPVSDDAVLLKARAIQADIRRNKAADAERQMIADVLASLTILADSGELSGIMAAVKRGSDIDGAVTVVMDLLHTERAKVAATIQDKIETLRAQQAVLDAQIRAQQSARNVLYPTVK